jgi:hypothetical protein
VRELVAIDFHGDDLKPAEGRSENADG